MKKYISFTLLLTCIFESACFHTVDVSEYSFEGKSIVRSDWDNVWTEMKYYGSDGKELGSALYYYPGLNGWFLIDNIWDTNKVILLLQDADPKVIINDSNQFAVSDTALRFLEDDKSRWRRSSNWEDAPVVNEVNGEYHSQIQYRVIEHKRCFRKPDWSNYPKEDKASKSFLERFLSRK